MANENIGHIKCPMAGVFCVVRKDKRNKLYYFSPVGKIAPNLPAGQNWMVNNSVLWPEGVMPENVKLQVVYAGMPPIVSVTGEPVKKQEEKPQKQSKKPLTEKSENNQKEKSLISELFKGWNDDE